MNDERNEHTENDTSNRPLTTTSRKKKRLSKKKKKKKKILQNFSAHAAHRWAKAMGYKCEKQQPTNSATKNKAGNQVLTHRSFLLVV
jgi:hypothetical protein